LCSAPCGRHFQRAQFVDEILGVIGFVGAQGDRLRPVGAWLDHMQRRNPLGVSIGRRQTGVDQKPVPVLHQGVPHEAKLGLLAGSFAIEPRIRIGGSRRASRSSGSAHENLLACCARRRRRAGRRLRFGLKLFIDAQASISVPATEKWSVLSNRFTRECARTPLNSLAAMSPSKRPVAVLGKCRMIPRRIVDADPDEPAKQQIELQPLHQLSLRADRIERLQEHRSHQLLRRDRRPSHPRIQRRKVAGERRQSVVHNHADYPQRMILINPSFKVDVAKQRARPLVLAPHDSLPAPSHGNRITSRFPWPAAFSTAC
jgi:hypothetical protein